jgi:predicted DNA-binding transcriptional regulator AlpA
VNTHTPTHPVRADLPDPDLLLLPDRKLANLLGISRAALLRLRSRGRLLRAVRLGRPIHWRADEVRQLVGHRVPGLASWESSKDCRSDHRWPDRQVANVSGELP